MLQEAHHLQVLNFVVDSISMKKPAPKPETKPLYPMRINKYLAWMKYATRKGGDEMVQNGKVYINGKRAVHGDKIQATDKVEVNSNKKPKNYEYYAYYKPRGVISHSPQRGEKDIRKASALKHVFPLGRLDKDSEGLIILTNDGRITDFLLNPKYEHDKEYIVTVSNPMRTNFAKIMSEGVDIEGYMTKPAKVKVVDEYRFKITLTEGKKHQIRRMCSALHNEVRELKRLRVMNIELGNLPSGSYRAIVGEELEIFLKSLGF